ncbi:MAG: hypothetical protein IT223_00295 [Crocinitomicaceae bacterium]|nr:hypothetical protein [Crocinitomicaceae bacterium]
MKKTVLILSILYFFCAMNAQDSLRAVTFENPVEIISFRNRYQQLSAPDSLQRIRHIASDLGRTLEASGIANVINYGSAGAASLLRIRGTAPDHSTVTWGSLPLNSVTLGMADCSLLPSFFFDGMEVGKNSSGSSPSISAISQGISLISQKPTAEQKKILLIQESNSMNNHFTAAEINGGSNRWAARSRIFYSTFDNRFSYTDNYQIGHPLLHQKNNDGTGMGWMQQLFYRGKKTTTSLNGWAVKRMIELPNIMGSVFPSYQKQGDNQQRVQLINEWNSGGENSTSSNHFLLWRNSFSWLRDEQYYLQASAEGQTPNIQSSVQSNQGIIISEFSARNSTQGIVASLQAVAVEAIYDHRRIRQQFFPIGSLKIWKKTGPVQSSISSRYEQRGGLLNTPAIILAEDFSIQKSNRQEIYLHIEASRKFRIPDFNELYWEPGGNPLLKPEKSLGVSGHLQQQLLDKNSREKLILAIESWYYSIHQWIQWLPGANGIWSPVNYKQVRTKGIEGSFRFFHYLGNTTVVAQGRYQWVEAIGNNQKEWTDSTSFMMVYQPRQKWYAGFDIIHRRWTFSVSYRYTGLRYTGENNSFRFALPGYSIVDVSAGINTTVFKLPLHWRISADNLLNQSYESVRSYAMPGRVLSISLSILFQKPHKP